MPPLRAMDTTHTTFKPLDHADWRIYFYFVSQLVGGVGLTFLLLTMLWPTKRRKPRNPLLISLCFSWWMSTFPCLCLLYYARQITGPPPSFGVCLASAALTMGQDILVGTTAPALLFNIWLIVKTAVGSRLTNDVWIARTTIFCLVTPYILFVVFALASVGVGLAEPQLVHRALFYCIVDDDRLTITLGAIGTATMLTAIALEIWTILLLYQNRACIRQLSREGHVSLVARVCAFGVYLFLGLCLNILSIVDWTNPVPDLFFSTFGIAVLAVFGTQRDIWRMWRDASRQMTGSTSRSQTSSPQVSPKRHPFYPFGIRSPSQANTPYPLSPSQRHLSLSQFNYSKSFSQSLSNHHGSDARSAISLPLPATLRPSSFISKPPAIVIHHSSPDLTNDSEPPTPTDENPPSVPDKDPQYLSPRLVHKISDFDIRLTPPSPTIMAGSPDDNPLQSVDSPISVSYDTSGLSFPYPPTTNDVGSVRTRGSRWSLRHVWTRALSIRSVRDDVGIASGDSRMMSPHAGASGPTPDDEPPTPASGSSSNGGVWMAR